MHIVLRLFFVTLACLTFSCSPALALSDTDARDCVLRMAEEMQSLPRQNIAAYEKFVTKHVDLDAITAAAVGRDWKNLTHKREMWKQAALDELAQDTITTLLNVEIGSIERPLVKRTKVGGIHYFIVSAMTGSIEVNVTVDHRCKVVDAVAAQVRASERIRDRIHTMYPEE